MIEVFELYISSFWAWLGLSIGLSTVLEAGYRLIVGSIAALRGTPVHFGDINNHEGN